MLMRQKAYFLFIYAFIRILFYLQAKMRRHTNTYTAFASMKY